MGACLGCLKEEDRSDGASRREAPRKRSRSGNVPNSARSMVERRGSTHNAPPPDFGVSSVYRVMDLLGEGGTGQTWLCQDLKTHRRVAVKFIPRPLAKVLVPMVSQEIQLQAQLSEGHIGLVRVESALLSKSHLGLVMEYVDGGTLTQYVTKRSANKGERGGLHLTEDEARYFFRQLIAAVEYLHVSHVAHRDLKMCNVVLTQRRPPTLKLCDFGFAKGWDEDSLMHTRIGTPVYMSPQLIESKGEGKVYSATAADVWACGVMLFAMLLGRFPYDHVGHPDPNSSGAHEEVLTEQLKARNGDWQSAPRVAPHVNLLSDECKDLLGKMLQTDERRRITIPDIRKHAWFAAELPPYLNEALREFEERQARLAKAMEAATEAQIKRRNKAVHDLIVMAGQPHNLDPPVRGLGSSAISAIFEVGTECDAASVASSPHVGPLSPTSPQVSPEKAGTAGTAGFHGQRQGTTGRAPGGSSADGSSFAEGAGKHEGEVLMIELAAVAKRTKSDGFVLMANFDPETLLNGPRNCQCESEGSEGHQIDSSSAGGGAGSGGSRGTMTTATTNTTTCSGATASGGADSPPEDATRAVQIVCEARGSAADNDGAEAAATAAESAGGGSGGAAVADGLTAAEVSGAAAAPPPAATAAATAEAGEIQGATEGEAASAAATASAICEETVESVANPVDEAPDAVHEDQIVGEAPAVAAAPAAATSPAGGGGAAAAAAAANGNVWAPVETGDPDQPQ